MFPVVFRGLMANLVRRFFASTLSERKEQGIRTESFFFQKLLLNGQADAAVAEANPGTAGTPWNNCGDCFAVFSDEEQVSVGNTGLSA